VVIMEQLIKFMLRIAIQGINAMHSIHGITEDSPGMMSICVLALKPLNQVAIVKSKWIKVMAI
jgi:hypothetical protein